MENKIQKRGFNLKPVTNCYNLIHKNACLIAQIFVYYSMIKGDKNMNDKCNKCKEHSSVITYKDKNYCTWYCAKKG